jgi:hypothetical protein
MAGLDHIRSAHQAWWQQSIYCGFLEEYKICVLENIEKGSNRVSHKAFRNLLLALNCMEFGIYCLQLSIYGIWPS